LYVQTITDYKGKTSLVVKTDVLLLDKLKTFFARFEDNTVPPTLPATKDYGHSFSVGDVRNVSVLTLARLLAQTASLAESSEHEHTNWLEKWRRWKASSSSVFTSLTN
jgi:hypothetical protein